MSFCFALPPPDASIQLEDEGLVRVASLRNASALNPAPDFEPSPSPGPPYRNVVFADPVAFRYLEEDSCVKVVERRATLRCYELYLVEQWACSRQSPTLVVVAYTGDEKHSVVVGVLGVPEDENAWSPRLRIYFKAIQQFHARPKETPLGQLMVTNLSGFPSALTVIPVPEGDIKKHRREFIVNENLKRLGCSGRSGMTLSEPNAAAKAKFLQLYKTNEKIPFPDAVVELVKLCQVALFLFGKLEQEYIDGLLCDVTERAIGNWWTEFGVEFYNIEPTDGILGPTTVSGLLGLLIGARNRLSYLGAPISKDVFDIDATKKAINYFQKSQKLERTRRLDRQTLHKLHGMTAKAAAGEAWGVQKAVKSTVTELGGKRGEMVLGMVSGRDKGGLGGVETLDLDAFISMVHGERAKWLWFGKPKRTPETHQERTIPDMSNLLFGREEPLSQTTSRQSLPPDDAEARRKEEAGAVYSTPAPPGSATSIAESPDQRDALRRGVFKSVTGKMSDVRSGFGRIKDAVYSAGGSKGHTSRLSKDESSETQLSATSSLVASTSAGLIGSPTVSRAFTWKNKPEEYKDAFRKGAEIISAPASILGSSEVPSGESRLSPHVEEDFEDAEEKRLSSATEIHNEMTKLDSSLAGSTIDEGELQGPALELERELETSLSQLHRRHSVAGMQPDQQPLNENRWPRRLSFSNAEDAVLRWTELTELDDDDANDADVFVERQVQLAEVARALYMSIVDTKHVVEPWVDTKIKAIESMDDYYTRQQEELQNLYYQLTDAVQRSKQNSQEVIAEQRARTTEAVKDVEVLIAKLEYEINALVSRVQDVEDGVDQFELQVEAVEKRADELKAQLAKESWLHWAVRKLTGMGTGPIITQDT